MDIVARAFELAGAVEALMERARRFYYEVMLWGHSCPGCGGRPVMLSESYAQCGACGRRFDPTLAFQRCAACDGRPQLRRTRYQCSRCGAEVLSRFLFDGIVFDREYFRKRMAESRERKQQQREDALALVTASRSEAVEPPVADLGSIPGLLEALDGLSMGPEMAALLPLCRGFDLRRYESHLQAHIGAIELCFDDIPPLEEDARKDRIWRFVAIVFMAHAGAIEVWQEGETIMVMEHEAHGERQGVPGTLEAADGV